MAISNRPLRNFVEPLESRRLLAVAVGINFQPAGATVPAGYLADTGATFAGRGNGYSYGFNQSASTFTRDRNKTSDQRKDTLVHTQLFGSRTWEIAVPNGQYSVHIVAGDPSYNDSVYKFNAEGVLTVSGTPTSTSRFVEGTKTVSVSDGRLTIANASGASNNKLCFVDIQSVTGNTLPSVSVAATDSGASEPGTNTGKFTITRTGSTASALTVNFTIGGSAAYGSDYQAIVAFVTIPAGAASANVSILPIDDGLAEGSETVSLTVKSSSAYTIGIPSASVTIADNDVPTPNGDWPTSWTSGPSNTRTRWESAAVVMDGKLWNFGGWMAASSTGTQDYAVYDPSTNKWTDLGQAPIPHTHSGIAADEGRHVIYFAGGLFGSYPGIPTNQVWKYDTIAKTWSNLPAMPENHSSGGLVFVNNELHYIGGVEDDRETNTGRHIVLNLANLGAGWQVAPSLPQPRDHFTHAVVEGQVYILGGEFGHDITHDQQALVHRYDPIAKTWTRLADMPTPKSHAESSTYVTPDGQIVVAGGQVADYKSTDEVVRYNPATNQWTTIGKLPQPLQGPVAQLIGDLIIVTTGSPGTGPIATTWLGTLS